MIKHSEGGSSGYAIYALSNIEEDQVKHDLMSHMGVSEEDADLFISIAKGANYNKQSKILSRLPGGGIPNVIAGYASSLKEVDKNVRDNMSYGKVLLPYWKDLTMNQGAGSVSEDYDEVYQDEEEIVLD